MCTIEKTFTSVFIKLKIYLHSRNNNSVSFHCVDNAVIINKIKDHSILSILFKSNK